MKYLITVSSAAVLLSAAIRWSGQSFDAGSVFAVVSASLLTALFVRDYHSWPRASYLTKPATVVRPVTDALGSATFAPVVSRVRAVLVTARFGRVQRTAAHTLTLGS